MVVCVGGRAAGKTLLLSQLSDPQFCPDTALLPTVGVNLYRVCGVVVRELGSALAPAWPQYLQTQQDLLYVVNKADPGQLGPAAVRLAECLQLLSCRPRPRLCLVWSRPGCSESAARAFGLPLLLATSRVQCTEVEWDPYSGAGLQQLKAWITSGGQ